MNIKKINSINPSERVISNFNNKNSQNPKKHNNQNSQQTFKEALKVKLDKSSPNNNITNLSNQKKSDKER